MPYPYWSKIGTFASALRLPSTDDKLLLFRSPLAIGTCFYLVAILAILQISGTRAVSNNDSVSTIRPWMQSPP